MDSLPYYIVAVDVNGEVIYTNPALQNDQLKNEKAFEQLHIGANYLKVLSKLDSPPLEHKELMEVMEGKIPYFQTTYAHTPQSEGSPFFIVVTPLFEQGNIIGATIVYREISDVEKESFDFYDVLENMTDAFISLDENWVITHVNKETEKLLSASKKELLGEIAWEKYPEIINPSFGEKYSLAMNQREKVSFEEYYEPKNVWLEVNVYPKEHGGIFIYFTNIDEKKVKEDKLWYAAHHDYSTALPNRLLLYKSLEQRIEENNPFVLFFLDINNFKLVNDAYGHEIGDCFILEFVKRLKMDLPEKFVLFRFEGDKFVLCTEYIDEFQVQSDAYHILTTIEKPFNNQSLPPLNFSASMGVSVFPEDGSIVGSLITAANTAMYEAKKMKSDQWRRYESEMSDSLNRRLIIETNLKEALLSNAVYTVFQPQVDTRKDEIIGIEVLARWDHSELGRILPDEFIPVAEETGQIRILTEHIIDKSLSKYSRWKKIFGFNGGISFNISSSLLNEASFVSFLLYQLEKHSIPPGILEIEITENVQIFSSAVIQTYMHDIQQAGINIAIDDFGVGYSNLSYLTNLPISKIKIDKYFMHCIGENPKGEAILQTIIVLANNLEMDVVAEGVETKEQRDFLKNNNCPLVQGFLYDTPLNEDQFIYRLQQFGIKYPSNA